MEFYEKYTTQKKKQKEPEKEKDKTELSDDAFALGDVIQLLINKIEHARLTLK